MKFKSLLSKSLLLTAVAFSLTGCGDDGKKGDASSSDTSVPKVIKIGVVPGPYREILDKYLKPVVEKRGHELKFVEFTDWVQPDSLGIFVFSEKYKTLDEIPEGSQVGIPNDAVNLARALRVARDLGVITLKSDKDEQKASIADIDKNPKDLRFVAMEAAQLPRSLDSVAAAFVPGNYAYAAKLDFEHALGAENVLEPIKLVIAVQNHRVNGVGKFLKECVEDLQFIKGVDSDPVFKNFAKPAWWPKN